MYSGVAPRHSKIAWSSSPTIVKVDRFSLSDGLDKLKVKRIDVLKFVNQYVVYSEPLR